MASEIRDLLQLNDSTVRKPIYEVYDALGSTDWLVERCTFQVYNTRSRTVLTSGDSDNPGECAINNNDVDRAGNEIKTVQPLIDLRGTDVERGSHMLAFHIYLDTAEDDVVRQLVQIVEYLA
jgi:hypothetical protein